MKRIRGVLERIDLFDALAFTLMVVVLGLSLGYWNKFPVHMDTGYHMAVTAGYTRAGGIALHSFWEFAPAGRAQLYPPLLHMLMFFFTKLGLSMITTARLVTFAAFPMILLSGWYCMRRMFSSRSAFYFAVLLCSCYLMFWHSAVESAASLVLILTPLIFLSVDRDKKVAASVLLALALYSHLTLGHLVALGLLVYAIHRREKFKEILFILIGAYLLWLPWGIQILLNYKSLAFDAPGGMGGITVHILVWLVALSGFVYCYFKKGKYYLLPSFLLGFIPIVFFYPDRFWNAHVFLPLAMLGGVALSGLHGFIKEKATGILDNRVARGALVSAFMVIPIALCIFVDPVYASSGRNQGTPPGGIRQSIPSPVNQVQYKNSQAQQTGNHSNQELPQPPNSGVLPVPPSAGNQQNGQMGGPPGGNPGGQGGPGGPSGNSGLHMAKTTIVSLLSSSRAGQQSLSGSSLIDSNTLLLAKLIEANSEPDDIVSIQNGSLGNLITGLTGRPSTSGMFHEVKSTTDQVNNSSTDAAIIVVSQGRQSGPMGTQGFAPGQQMQAADTQTRTTSGVDTTKYKLVGTAGGYSVYRSVSSTTSAAVSGTVIPWYMVFILIILAIAAILIDWFRPDRKTTEGEIAWENNAPYDKTDNNRANHEVLAIIPCYNEEASIGKLVAELRYIAPSIDILVIDDGSNDNSSHIAQRAGATVITHQRNTGIGAAVRTGMSYALVHGYDFAVQVDGDGQHDPRYIASILGPLLYGSADLVIGSRFLGTEGYKPPFARRIGTALLSAVVTLTTGRKTKDTTSGFRAMNRKALEFLVENYSDDYPESESLVLMHKRGFVWKEIPVSMRRREYGISSIKGFNSARYMARVLSRITLDAMGFNY